MSGWRTVEAVLRDHRVHDVLVPGWIDRDDDLPEFRPQPMVVWLRLDEGLLRFESQGQYDRLGASRVPGVDWADIELLAEAEDEVIVASFGEQLFGDGRDALRCAAARLSDVHAAPTAPASPSTSRGPHVVPGSDVDVRHQGGQRGGRAALAEAARRRGRWPCRCRCERAVRRVTRRHRPPGTQRPFPLTWA